MLSTRSKAGWIAGSIVRVTIAGSPSVADAGGLTATEMSSLVIVPDAGPVLHDSPVGNDRSSVNVSSEFSVDVTVDRDVDDLLGLAGREGQLLRCERGEVDALGCGAARRVDGDRLATDRRVGQRTVNEAITVSGMSPSVTGDVVDRDDGHAVVVLDRADRGRVQDDAGTGRLSSVSVTCSSASIVLSPLMVTMTGVVVAPTTNGTVTSMSAT